MIKRIIVITCFALTLVGFSASSVYAACGPSIPISTPCSSTCPEIPDPSQPPGFHNCTGVPNNIPPTSSTTSTPLGFICGLGPLGDFFCKNPTSDVTPASNLLASVLSGTVGIITICAGFWFMLQILMAGFGYISAGGSKEKIQESQHKITNSVIGLVIVVAAYALTSLFGKILGIPNILNIGAVIKNIGGSINKP